MKAAWYEKNGTAAEVLQVGEIEDQAPGAGEVRVKLHASGVNPSDVKNRAGSTRKLAFPFQIPNSDGAGTVDSVGEGVQAFRQGERVWVSNGAFQRQYGTAAQAITLPAALVAPLPPGIDFPQGACLGIPVMTAHRCVFADGAVRGKWLLVAGGAGVVGHYAVQLAKWGGARVIATVSSEQKAQHALAAGADHIINYKTNSVPEEVARLTDGKGVERIIEVDLAGNLEQDLQIIRNEGVIVIYGTSASEARMPGFVSLIVNNPIIRMVLVYTMSSQAKQAAIGDITAWVAEGKPQFTIAHRLPLEDIVLSNEAVEQPGRIGHVILDIS